MNVKFLFLLFLLPICIHAECTCEEESGNLHHSNKSQALIFKLIAIASILVAGVVGVCVPMFGKVFESFGPESNIFLTVKFFASGVILATGFVHVFPDANESLENPCLGDKAWGDFPLGYFVAMLAAVVVMVVETAFTTRLSKKLQCSNKMDVEVLVSDEEKDEDHMQVDKHKPHGTRIVSKELQCNNKMVEVVAGDEEKQEGSSESLLSHRIISLVLEAGIIIHSIIIGMSLGVSVHPKTIKPLIAALSFHQMFEGMGLGSCIIEAKFEVRKVVAMLIAFSVTTPFGIALGIGIANTYDENSHIALIVQGLLNATSAGILIYMALVDLLSLDFMKSKIQTSAKLQAIACISILLGIGCMSVLAIWA